MQSVYDTLRDFALVLADHDTDIDEQYRGLHRGVKVTGTNERNEKVFSDVPYILRSTVTVDPDKTKSKHGSFSMAMPAIVVEENNTLLLRVLNRGGQPEEKLMKISDWELPEGGKDGIADGDSGVLVVGTEIDEEKKIFIPGRSALVADHRGMNATLGSSIVRDLGPSELKSLLAKSMWIARTPGRVDAQRRNAITWNALSMGARSGKPVEHQGGAVTLYNTNIQSFAGEIPRVISWAAELDDGPFFAGEGHRDQHIKGVDDEGMPHLPLMFKKERTKFGPGPKRTPSAPFDFLEYFAAPPKYSSRIFRAEIVYDKEQFHPNPSGIIHPVMGRWVVQYRLPHRPPFDDPTIKDMDDRGAKPDPVNKPPIDDPVGKPAEDAVDKGSEDAVSKGTPETGDPPEPDNPVTGDPPKPKPNPGPGNSNDGPGHCGQPGGTPSDAGPGDSVGGPGEDGEAEDNTPVPSTGPGSRPTTQEEQERKQAALKKAREAEAARAVGTIGDAFPEDQSNVTPQHTINSVLHAADIRASAQAQRAPMTSHMGVAYPYIKALIPDPEFESLHRATVRDNLSAEETEQVDNWAMGSAQMVGFGNTVLDDERLTTDKTHRIVTGGFVIAGSDLAPENIYDGESNLTAKFVMREEAKLIFGNPDKDGTIPTGHVFERDVDNNEFVFRAQDLASGLNAVLTERFHFKSPARITQVTNAERLALDHYDGLVVLDTDDATPYMSVGGAWLDLGQQDTDTGETNTASNLGAGEGVFYQKSGVDLEFKSLVVASPLVISSDANEILFSFDDAAYFLHDGSRAMTGDLDLDGNFLDNVAGLNLDPQTSSPGGFTIWCADGTAYNNGTLVWEDEAVIEGNTSIGDPGNEQGTVKYRSNDYDVRFKANSIGSGHDGSIMAHVHSTTNHPEIVGFRANSNTASHAAITNGQTTLEVFGAGWSGSGSVGYLPTGGMRFSVSGGGTISSTSMPGKVEIGTTADGADNWVSSITIDRDHIPVFNYDIDMGANDITNVGTVDGVNVSAHTSRHERGGSDEIDGDHLDIDFTPSNYSPSTSPGEAAHVDDLAAHLAGIDDALASSGGLSAHVQEFRLTISSGNPVYHGSGSSSTIYMTPYTGNRIALYNTTDSVWEVHETAQISVGSFGTGVYDIFAYDNSGTVTLERVSWYSTTARATALTRQDGVYVKSGDASRRYIGTVYAGSGSVGIDDDQIDVWNMNNRVRGRLKKVDTTTSWTYSTNTWRQARGSASNDFKIVQGVAEDCIDVELDVACSISADAPEIAIGEDTNSPHANCSIPHRYASNSHHLHAQLKTVPAVGRHEYRWLEKVEAGTVTFRGEKLTGASNWRSMLSATWWF